MSAACLSGKPTIEIVDNLAESFVRLLFDYPLVPVDLAFDLAEAMVHPLYECPHLAGWQGGTGAWAGSLDGGPPRLLSPVDVVDDLLESPIHPFFGYPLVRVYFGVEQLDVVFQPAHVAFQPGHVAFQLGHVASQLGDASL